MHWEGLMPFSWKIYTTEIEHQSQKKFPDITGFVAEKVENFSTLCEKKQQHRCLPNKTNRQTWHENQIVIRDNYFAHQSYGNWLTSVDWVQNPAIFFRYEYQSIEHSQF